MRKDKQEKRCKKKGVRSKSQVSSLTSRFSNSISQIPNLASVNRKGTVAADMLVNIVCFTIIVLFMVLYWIFSTPVPIQNASFSGDVIDMSAEQFAATLYKTPTDDGTFVDSIQKYLGDVELRGEEYATKKLFRKFLAGNPLRYHQADWIITITEGDTKQGFIQSEDTPTPKMFMITNPFYEAFHVPGRHESPESLRTKMKPNFNRAGSTLIQRFKWYYHSSTPIVITHKGREYTVQVYYITSQVLNKIVPVLDGRDIEGELLLSDIFNGENAREIHGEKISERITYEPVSSTKECAKIFSCDEYQKDENSCNDDPCYVSKTYCTFKSDEQRCVER